MAVKNKQSNYELLRIISMLLIIGTHLYEHTDGLMFAPMSFNKLVSIILGSFGVVGVDCFVLISAWFMIDSSHFKCEKIIAVIIQTVFYSLLLYISVQLFTGKEIAAKEIIKCFIGFANDSYWFVTAYLVMVILSPVVNFFLREISNKQLKIVVYLLFFCFFVWKFILWSSPVNSIEFFIFIYILAAYLKRVGNNSWIYKYRFEMFILLVVITILFGCLVSALPETVRLSALVKYIYTSLLAKFSPLMLCISIALFYIVSNWKIESKIINSVGTRTFSVYLIHENEFVYSSILWGGI